MSNHLYGFHISNHILIDSAHPMNKKEKKYVNMISYIKKNIWTNKLYFPLSGYEGTSTDPGLAYRAEVFPGLGFLLKKSFYETQMKGKMQQCCKNR